MTKLLTLHKYMSCTRRSLTRVHTHTHTHTRTHKYTYLCLMLQLCVRVCVCQQLLRFMLCYTLLAEYLLEGGSSLWHIKWCVLKLSRELSINFNDFYILTIQVAVKKCFFHVSCSEKFYKTFRVENRIFLRRILLKLLKEFKILGLCRKIIQKLQSEMISSEKQQRTNH